MLNNRGFDNPKSGAPANFVTLAEVVTRAQATQRSSLARLTLVRGPHSTLRFESGAFFCAICTFGIDISQAIVISLAR